MDIADLRKNEHALIDQISSMQSMDSLIEPFRQQIYDYFYAFGRHDLAWRNNHEPYSILISEVMLQQTQVDRVRDKYSLFLNTFPTVNDLAQAELKDLLSVWQGLGYNRRALFLQRAAQSIMDHHNGVIPDTEEGLRTLPGIGAATASSICAFAYNKPVVFIETNIRSVYIHFFYNDDTAVSDAQLKPIIEKTLDFSSPRIWYYALMDYGVMLKKTGVNPNRKSAHYARQSRFEGSDRQIRGAVLRILGERAALSQNELYNALGFDRERLQRILSNLIDEGFLSVSGDTYSVR